MSDTTFASSASSGRTELSDGARLGLRERKKLRTRQAIRRAAYHLFEQRGYNATSVEDIASAADVSPSTVFRYFATKEDIVLTDEQDSLLQEGLRARPADEHIVESLRHVCIDVLCHLASSERTELIQRIRLTREVPILRARVVEQAARDVNMLAALLAERTGHNAITLQIRVVCVAVMAAVDETLWHWITRGQQDDLLSLLNSTMDVFANGMSL